MDDEGKYYMDDPDAAYYNALDREGPARCEGCPLRGDGCAGCRGYYGDEQTED